MAMTPPTKTPAQLAQEAARLAARKAEQARLMKVRGSTMSAPVARTAEQRKAEQARLMKVRGSDVPKPKPKPAPAATPPVAMKRGGMVKGKK